MEERDITSEKDLKNQINLSDFFNSATDLISLWDENLNLIMSTKSMTQIYTQNTSRNSLYGKNIIEFDHEVKNQGRFEKYLQVLENGLPHFENDVVLSSLQGERHYAIKVFKVGNYLGMIINDINERIKLEEELNNYRDRLRELVQERTIELEKKNKELEDKNFELERYNQLFIGREFRIKELRSKVKNLEDELNYRMV